jgi:hypothetical protein
VRSAIALVAHSMPEAGEVLADGGLAGHGVRHDGLLPPRSGLTGLTGPAARKLADYPGFPARFSAHPRLAVGLPTPPIGLCEALRTRIGGLKPA